MAGQFVIRKDPDTKAYTVEWPAERPEWSQVIKALVKKAPTESSDRIASEMQKVQKLFLYASEKLQVLLDSDMDPLPDLASTKLHELKANLLATFDKFDRTAAIPASLAVCADLQDEFLILRRGPTSSELHILDLSGNRAVPLNKQEAVALERIIARKSADLAQTAGTKSERTSLGADLVEVTCKFMSLDDAVSYGQPVTKAHIAGVLGRGMGL